MHQTFVIFLYVSYATFNFIIIKGIIYNYMAKNKITSRRRKITRRRNKNTMKRKTYRKKRKTIKRINKRIYKKQQEGGDVVAMLLSGLAGAAAAELASRPILRDKHQCKWGEGRRFGRCKNRYYRAGYRKSPTDWTIVAGGWFPPRPGPLKRWSMLPNQDSGSSVAPYYCPDHYGEAANPKDIHPCAFPNCQHKYYGTAAAWRRAPSGWWQWEGTAGIGSWSMLPQQNFGTKKAPFYCPEHSIPGVVQKLGGRPSPETIAADPELYRSNWLMKWLHNPTVDDITLTTLSKTEPGTEDFQRNIEELSELFKKLGPDDMVSGYIMSHHGAVIDPERSDFRPILKSNFNLIIPVALDDVNFGPIDFWPLAPRPNSLEARKNSLVLYYARQAGPLTDENGCLTEPNGYFYKDALSRNSSPDGRLEPWPFAEYSIGDTKARLGRGWINFIKETNGGERYNEHKFVYNLSNRQERATKELFGVLFTYNEGGELKQIKLPLVYLLKEGWRGPGRREENHCYITLSEVLLELETTYNLTGSSMPRFYFTNPSCRSDRSTARKVPSGWRAGTARTKLTKELSRVKEEKSLDCFYKLFNDEHATDIKRYFESMGWKTINEFYRYLEEINKFTEYIKIHYRNKEVTLPFTGTVIQSDGDVERVLSKYRLDKYFQPLDRLNYATVEEFLSLEDEELFNAVTKDLELNTLDIPKMKSAISDLKEWQTERIENLQHAFIMDLDRQQEEAIQMAEAEEKTAASAPLDLSVEASPERVAQTLPQD